MKYKLLSFLLLLFLINKSEFCAGQKKALDIKDLGKWPTAGEVNISANGKYLFFYIMRLTNSRPKDRSLELKSTGGKEWRRVLQNVKGGAQFSTDSRHLIVPVLSDTLLIFQLGSNLVQRIPNVASFKV